MPRAHQQATPSKQRRSKAEDEESSATGIEREDNDNQKTKAKSTKQLRDNSDSENDADNDKTEDNSENDDHDEDDICDEDDAVVGPVELNKNNLFRVHFALHDPSEPSSVILLTCESSSTGNRQRQRFPIAKASSNKCRCCRVNGVTLMVQNTAKKSEYSNLARKGHKITWVMPGGAANIRFQKWGLIHNNKIEQLCKQMIIDDDETSRTYDKQQVEAEEERVKKQRGTSQQQLTKQQATASSSKKKKSVHKKKIIKKTKQDAETSGDETDDEDEEDKENKKSSTKRNHDANNDASASAMQHSPLTKSTIITPIRKRKSLTKSVSPQARHSPMVTCSRSPLAALHSSPSITKTSSPAKQFNAADDDKMLMSPKPNSPKIVFKREPAVDMNTYPNLAPSKTVIRSRNRAQKNNL